MDQAVAGNASGAAWIAIPPACPVGIPSARFLEDRDDGADVPSLEFGFDDSVDAASPYDDRSDLGYSEHGAYDDGAAWEENSGGCSDGRDSDESDYSDCSYSD